jgi:hypothetical protein
MEDIDPLTLEPISQSTRILVFNRGHSKVRYDFDFFYQHVHQLKYIPHTREPFTDELKSQFNDTCKMFNVPPAFPEPQHLNETCKDWIFLVVLIGIVIVAHQFAFK